MTGVEITNDTNLSEDMSERQISEIDDNDIINLADEGIMLCGKVLQEYFLHLSDETKFDEIITGAKNLRFYIPSHKATYELHLSLKPKMYIIDDTYGVLQYSAIRDAIISLMKHVEVNAQIFIKHMKTIPDIIKDGRMIVTPHQSMMLFNKTHAYNIRDNFDVIGISIVRIPDTLSSNSTSSYEPTDMITTMI